MVSYSAVARVFLGKAFECCIYSLFFRADKAYLHFAFLQGKDLWSEHGRIGDADELVLFLLNIVPGDDEEPGAIRRAMDVGSLDLPVNALFFF